MPKATKEKVSTRTARCWQFTDFKGLKTLKEIKDEKGVEYVGYGEEVCPTTNRQHRQGMIYFKEPVRMTQVKTTIGGDPHVEPTRFAEALDKYNRKEGKFHELGTRPKQGARTDIMKAQEVAKTCNGDIKMIMEQVPVEYIKYSRGLEKMAEAFQHKIHWRTVKGYIIWGKSSTGKTHYAKCQMGEENVYTLKKAQASSSTTWWNGYEGQTSIILDEFSPPWLDFSDVLAIIDGHYYQVQTKGGFVQAKWTHVFITANHHPDTWWPNIRKNNKPSWDAFIRRIKWVHSAQVPIKCGCKLDVPEVACNTEGNFPEGWADDQPTQEMCTWENDIETIKLKK